MLNSLKGKRINLKSGLQYVSIFMFTFIIYILIYNSFLGILEKDNLNNAFSMLRHSVDIMDRNFSSIDKYANIMVNDNKIRNFGYISEPYKDKNVSRILELNKHLGNYNYINVFESDYYLFFKKSNMILYKDHVYNLPREYNKKSFYIDNNEYSSWYKKCFDTYYRREALPGQKIYISGTDEEKLQYIYSIGYPFNVNAVIVFTFNCNDIIKLFSEINISNGGWFYIENEKGKILISSNGFKESQRAASDMKSGNVVQRTDNGKMLVSCVVSEYNGWRYVSAQPMSNIEAKVKNIKQIATVIAALYIFIGFLISCLLAYYNNKPIRELFSIIKTWGKENDEKGTYESLKKSMIEIIENYKSLVTCENRKMPFVKQIFFQNLIDNKYRFEEDIKLFVQNIGINMDFNYFAVSILSLSKLHQMSYLEQESISILNAKKILLKEIINRECLDDTVLCVLYEFDPDKIVFIHSFDFPDTQTCTGYIDEYYNRVSKLIKNEIQIEFFIAVSDMHINYCNIAKAYSEAVQAYNMNTWEKIDFIAWYEDIKEKSKTFYVYSENTNVSIINYARAGCFEEVKNIISKLFKENFKENSLSSEMGVFLIYDLSSSLIRIMKEINISEDYIKDFINEINYSKLSVSQSEKLILEGYSKLCDTINQKKQSHNDKMILNIKKYIEENFNNPNLSLSRISDEFSLSQVYISKFFKEQMGINFYEYVENLRIDYAKKLLSETNLAITDISDKLGYNSINTFGKAFKRRTGINCSEYRSSIGKVMVNN